MKKARKWLNENTIEHEFHDYKKMGIDEATLRSWVSVVGWEALVNQRGTTWRKLPQELRDSMNEQLAIEQMIENPSLIKRPVAIKDKHIEVGFKEESYRELFG